MYFLGRQWKDGFPKNQKYRLVLFLQRFLWEHFEVRQLKRQDEWPADALSTPSSFHCCFSQDPYTYPCLPSLLLSVILELCSDDLPPKLFLKRELASTQTDSLFRYSYIDYDFVWGIVDGNADARRMAPNPKNKVSRFLLDDRKIRSFHKFLHDKRFFYVCKSVIFCVFPASFS